MGVKLEWEIEDEQVAYKDLGENPQDVRQRRANRVRTLVAMLIVAGTIVAVVVLVLARLWYVDRTIRNELRETVEAEVAALRIGDIAAFLYVQRSESDAWMLGQTDQFWGYQQLKLDHDLELTGKVLDLVVDENRGRALVEEVIDGARYQRLWFYWRYADGWRHVPSDVTFWGDLDAYEGNATRIEYGELDSELANELGPTVDVLWQQACIWLACTESLPPLTVRVMAEPSVGVSWSPDEANVLRIASPLTRRAKADVVLEPGTARAIGTLLAERLVSHAQHGMTAQVGTDADFLQGALENWLVGRFLGDGGVMGSSYVESIVQSYGEHAVGLLTQALQPDSTIRVLSAIFVTPLDQLRVEWREYFQWRLALEPFMLSQGNQAGFLSLYDDLARNEAQVLMSDPDSATRAALTVLRVVVGPGTDGDSRAWAVVQYPDGSEGPVTFRLVDGVWLRSAHDPAFSESMQQGV